MGIPLNYLWGSLSTLCNNKHFKKLPLQNFTWGDTVGMEEVSMIEAEYNNGFIAN